MKTLKEYLQEQQSETLEELNEDDLNDDYNDYMGLSIDSYRDELNDLHNGSLGGGY